MEIVLVHPEIPHNSGCAARLTAALGLRLHLVEPLGFSLEDRYLKRAGLDYWPAVELVVHRDWAAAERALARIPPQAEAALGSGTLAVTHADRLPGRGSARPIAERLRLFTARGGTSLFETRFEPDDVLVFGSESSGIPRELLDAHPARRVYVPIRPCVRSLNLANVVALATYTALVRSGVPLPDNDGAYAPDARADEDIWPVEVTSRVER